MSLLHTPNGPIYIECDTGDVSDGYHTFNELYRHRCLLWAFICSRTLNSFKTRKTSSGDQWPGWFIAGMNTPHGQITYHLPDSLWDLVDAKEIDRNDDYDGHTARDVADRLEALLEGYIA